MAHSAALLLSGCALALSFTVWLNVRAGCSQAALSLGGAASGLPERGGRGGGAAGSLQQQLRQQQERVHELEIQLLDERQKVGSPLRLMCTPCCAPWPPRCRWLAGCQLKTQ